jgi:hypothetical protein
MNTVLINPTRALLDKIEDNKLHKKDISQTYALALLTPEKIDWEKVNRAIINRWSISALIDIKNWAWNELSL